MSMFIRSLPKVDYWGEYLPSVSHYFHGLDIHCWQGRSYFSYLYVYNWELPYHPPLYMSDCQKHNKASLKKHLSFMFHLNDSPCVLIGLRPSVYFIWILLYLNLIRGTNLIWRDHFFIPISKDRSLVCRRPIIMLMRAFVQFVRGR